MEEARERKNFAVCLMTISFFHVLFSFFFVSQVFVPKGETQGRGRIYRSFVLLTTVTHPLHLCLALSAPLPVRPKASWILGANCERLSNFTPPPPWPHPPSYPSHSLPSDICWLIGGQIQTISTFLFVYPGQIRGWSWLFNDSILKKKWRIKRQLITRQRKSPGVFWTHIKSHTAAVQAHMLLSGNLWVTLLKWSSAVCSTYTCVCVRVFVCDTAGSHRSVSQHIQQFTVYQHWCQAKAPRFHLSVRGSKTT